MDPFVNYIVLGDVTYILVPKLIVGVEVVKLTPVSLAYITLGIITDVPTVTFVRVLCVELISPAICVVYAVVVLVVIYGMFRGDWTVIVVAFS